MVNENKLEQNDALIWQEFANKYSLSHEQLNQFKIYAKLLVTRNEEINLTNITKLNEIIYYHFEDSLSITKFIDFNSIKSISDIGTGAGFPGIPLKIKYPHLNVVLIEVTNKKIIFLNEVIQELSLSNIEIFEFDWRTFLRKSDYSIDMFLSRASLHTDELIRIFKSSSPYKSAQLVYWASIFWKPTSKDQPYLKKEETYKVGSKIRKLIFFKN